MKKLAKAIYDTLPSAIRYMRPALPTLVACVLLLLAILALIASHIQFK